MSGPKPEGRRMADLANLPKKTWCCEHKFWDYQKRRCWHCEATEEEVKADVDETKCEEPVETRILDL